MKLLKTNIDTAVTIPDEIIKDYDRTIEKCNKVVIVYPKNKKWHDNAMYVKAKATYYKGDLELAISRFINFQKEFTQSPFVPESHLFLAKAYLENGNPVKAEETLRNILEKYPALNNNHQIDYLLAQTAIKLEGRSQAILILEKSLQTVRSDKEKLEIIIQLAGLYTDLKIYGKAEEVSLKAPRNANFPNLLFRIDFYLLLSYENQKHYEKALALSARMLKNKQYLQYSGKIQLERAIVFTLMNRIDEAVDALEKITKGPGVKTVPKEIQARGWYELGLIYQHKKGDFEKARECYDNVIKTGANPNLADLAKEKIAAIDQLKEADKKLASLRGQSGKSVDSIHYNYGEVYWLKLSEADSALNHFLAICADTKADSGFVMKSMYASAWILRFIKNDTTRSDSIYSAIIKRYPATNVAQRAQQDLGVPVTVLTRQDSALQAFVDAEKLYFDNQDPVGAVNAYYKVAKKYRDITHIAAHSIYAAGWICNNVLAKNTKAFMLFKMLCDSFPNTELCEKGARQQVKYVEDTLKIIQASKKKETGKKQKTGKSVSDTVKTQEADTSDLLMTDDGKQNVQSTPQDTSKHTMPDTTGQGQGANTILSPQLPADILKKSVTDTTKKQNQNQNPNTGHQKQEDQIQQQKEFPVQDQL